MCLRPREAESITSVYLLASRSSRGRGLPDVPRHHPLHLRERAPHVHLRVDAQDPRSRGGHQLQDPVGATAHVRSRDPTPLLYAGKRAPQRFEEEGFEVLRRYEGRDGLQDHDAVGSSLGERARVELHELTGAANDLGEQPRVRAPSLREQGDGCAKGVAPASTSTSITVKVSNALPHTVGCGEPLPTPLEGLHTPRRATQL